MHPVFPLLLASLALLKSSAGEDVQFAKPVFKDGRFENPKSFTNWTGVPGLFKLAKLILTEKNLGKIPGPEVLNRTIPVHALSNFSADSDFFAAWLGHSTMIVHMDGATFITDPIWKDKASPIPFVGANRYRPSPIKIDDLPKIDFAIVSHDHYDHLDEVTVRKIGERNPKMYWFVPLGMKAWMHEEGINGTVVELNWGESKTINVKGRPFELWCLPAQHWGQRGPLDRNERLWSGWAVVGPKRKFYYSGDTGFCRDEFDKIGRKFGSFDLAAIPIGCFEPRWFMKAQHISPVEALEIHKLVRSQLSVGLHWGTYEMGAYEGYLEPKLLLSRLMAEESQRRTKPFVTWNPGEIWTR